MTQRRAVWLWCLLPHQSIATSTPFEVGAVPEIAPVNCTNQDFSKDDVGCMQCVVSSPFSLGSASPHRETHSWTTLRNNHAVTLRKWRRLFLISHRLCPGDASFHLVQSEQ